MKREEQEEVEVETEHGIVGPQIFMHLNNYWTIWMNGCGWFDVDENGNGILVVNGVIWGRLQL